MAFAYPVSLDLHGRRCVVIGGGTIAEHKARGLLEAGGIVTVVAPEATEGLKQLAARAELAVVARAYAPGDLEGAFVAIAATDDPEVNARVFAEAEERKVLLNAVDDVRHCHFAAPSIVRHGDFCIAISTGGKAPALAKRIRRDLSRSFGPEYGVLVEVLGQARAEALDERRAVSFEVWARRWQEALENDVLALVRAGRLDEARTVVVRALQGTGCRKGRVSIVGAGPGDPDLISVRGRKALESADVVVYDRLVHPALIEGRNAVFVGKKAGEHHVPQDDINDLLVELARAGKSVVRLKGGDPFVFGRGAEEAEALAAAGVDFEVVPAPTSATAAAAYAGIPVTDRRSGSSVAFATGHCSGDRQVDWRALGVAADTVVVLMGLKKIDYIVAEMIAGGRDPRTPAALIENGTLPEQRVVTAELVDLPAAAQNAAVRSPTLIVVGDVVAARHKIEWFGTRPPAPIAASKTP